MKKRFIAAALAAMLILSACKNEEVLEETFAPQQNLDSEEISLTEQETTNLVLACGRNFGESHPSQAAAPGEKLLPLIYESLVELDDSYRWVGGLAEDIQQDGLSYVITIKEAVFSDGTAVTASDAANSLKAAKSSGSHWRDQLSIIDSVVVLDKNKLRIITNQQRQDFINLLNFPICNSKYLGSGQYCLKDKDGKNLQLIKNPNYSGKITGPETIDLLELYHGDTLLDSLKIGIISSAFDDLSSGAAVTLSDKSQTVDIGHLVFMGINCQKGIMEQSAFRRAVSSAVDRDFLCERVYSSRAEAAYTPFHTDYYRIADFVPSDLSLEEAQALLEQVGLAKSNKGNYIYITIKDEDKPSKKEEDKEPELEIQDSWTLLYNSENPYRLQLAEILQQQFANLGLKIEPVGLPYEEYMSALQAGDFDFYIGELAIDVSMDVGRLFSPGNGYGYGCAYGNGTETVYRSYQQGQSSIKLFLDVFQQNMPVVPLLYRQGIIVSKEGVEESFISRPGAAYGAVVLQ